MRLEGRGSMRLEGRDSMRLRGGSSARLEGRGSTRLARGAGLYEAKRREQCEARGAGQRG
jgi:hypothetical protein